jgi:hypothetical protein
MAIEDQKYDDMVNAVNALLKTGRPEMVRGWLIRFALDILRHYGYAIAVPPPTSDQDNQSTSK